MMTKRELFNAKNAGKKIEAGLQIDVVKCGQFNDTDKDGHDVVVSALQCADGSIYTTISATISSSLGMLEDIIADEEHVIVKVNENTSNNGRKFFQLEIL